MADKLRLDALLVLRGLVESRERARAVIMAGHVLVAGDREDKPGRMVQADCDIVVKDYVKQFVSRGGFKLQQALDCFGIDLQGKVCLDAGASTGGFTDCMLQRGAATVYAVDVGYGQLAWSLRNDARVINLERTNVRYLDHSQVGQPVDFISIDVSFISLKLVLPPLAALLSPRGHMVALVKPQFEAGKGQVGKKGVVRDKAVHRAVLEHALEEASQSALTPLGLTHSPIKGPQGNIEFLLYLQKQSPAPPAELDLAAIIQTAHDTL